MFWDDFGTKVSTATWTRLSFHSHFQFLLATLKGITIQPEEEEEEEEEQQAGAGEELGYEATSSKAAQEGPAQKTRLSTRLLEKVLFCSPRPPRFSTSLFSFPFQGENGSIPPGGVLACRRFCDSPNPSIGESSNEDEQKNASIQF